jgi:ferredoxin
MQNGDKQIKLCDCNRSSCIDPAALSNALDACAVSAQITFHTDLCRGEIAAVDDACRSGGDLLIGCTQEATLFSELAEDSGAAERLDFLNIRELAGWSAEAGIATPKMAALIAAAQLPAADPVPGVTMNSAGNLLIVGEAGAALGWAERLKEQLTVTVLMTGRGGAETELPVARQYPIFSGRVTSFSGHLGAFDIAWAQENPIDLDLCVRCNACIRACPEGAIGYDYQVDATRCKSHGACVTACGDIQAIDFARPSAAASARNDRFDLVLDLSATPLLNWVELPQGYRAPGRDPLDQALAVQDLLTLTGEFDKPQYVAFREKLCAHSRAKKSGCNNCIDVCATQAIVSNGNTIKVDPYLCQGCGTCTTVCPSGALTYQYPRVADLGLRVKTLLSAYRQSGGTDPVLLFHSAEAGRQLVDQLARRGKGLPARVIPVETWSADAVGLDLLLGAYALGAAQVAVLGTGSHDLTPLRQQAGFAQTILSALGCGGEHFRIIDADDYRSLENSLWDWAPAAGVGQFAEFRLMPEKRTTLNFAIDHLAAHAPTPQAEIALAAGAPFGTIAISDACTLCMSCVGACPAGALKAAADAPRLSFLESQCLQCGLCEKSCPEQAIALTPRLLLGAERRERVLREAEIFCCTACGKPMGAKPMITAMLAKLAGHSMFSGEREMARLSMCADCRVIDLMKTEQSTQAWEMNE